MSVRGFPLFSVLLSSFLFLLCFLSVLSNHNTFHFIFCPLNFFCQKRFFLFSYSFKSFFAIIQQSFPCPAI
ncbi:hypothetical protein BACCAP_04785 [Pseudoflavonifractor capillosus ATCC 29799]|uniref:Uncharacterized protein n=1 Tax=Pseudoflavonifractor capillosus ATCC 29799 TaxID=411467 RepID=A6P2Q3_9FIRM|nr:hypothetical protein BACCAP_04785 [Pseudoflavonifractor capillosus ATCC 29799]